eukprot:CAMPEP_0202687018 /NCGR_PEP_ID=MMETSP1385-20130828/2738_1 /ASSEMBLY_ACC=CAM_ASM_000861 /TAXON_ID=933848 /ORGANISM="Elphidium margaritaceum" /LENGTH=973 /DNA_ID=CAMNT_0049341727 /DNA_START=149 /DNA_END=3070 /DNA_ORIENTATION=+
MPIPRERSLNEISTAIRERIHDEIGLKLPVEFKVYILAQKLTPQITNDFDINGIIQIQIPSKKPEAVDKRLICDIMFDLYELERDHKSRAIALISGDKDFGHTLSKIKDVPPISHSFLILLRQVHMDRNMHSSVHKLLQFDFGGSATTAAAVNDREEGYSSTNQNQSPPFVPARAHSLRKHNYAARSNNSGGGGGNGFRDRDYFRHKRHQAAFGRQRYHNRNAHAQRPPPVFPYHHQPHFHANNYNYNHNHNHHNFAPMQSPQLLDMYSRAQLQVAPYDVVDASHDQKVADPAMDAGYVASYSVPGSSPEPNSSNSKSPSKNNTHSANNKTMLTLNMVSCLDHNDCVRIRSKPSNQIQNILHELHEKIKHQYEAADKSQLILYHKDDKPLTLYNKDGKQPRSLQQAGIGDGDTLYWFTDLRRKASIEFDIDPAQLVDVDVDVQQAVAVADAAAALDDDTIDDEAASLISALAISAENGNNNNNNAKIAEFKPTIASLNGNVNFMVQLQSIDNDQTFECCISRSEYVLTVRRKVFDIVATATRLRDERGISLFYDGQELRDHVVIQNVGISDGDILLFDVDENCPSDTVAVAVANKNADVDVAGILFVHKPGDYPSIVRAIDPQSTIHFLKTLVLHRFNLSGGCGDVNRVCLECDGKRLDNDDDADDARRTVLQCGLQSGDSVSWVYNTEVSTDDDDDDCDAFTSGMNGEEEEDDAGEYADEEDTEAPESPESPDADDDDDDDDDDEKEALLKLENDNCKVQSSSDMQMSEVSEPNMFEADDDDDDDVVKDLPYSPSQTPAPPPMKREDQISVIVLQEWNNMETCITLARSDTISELKQQIEKRLGMKTVDQILEMNGRYLADDDNDECISKYIAAGDNNDDGNGDNAKLGIRLKIVQEFCVNVEVLQGEQLSDMPVCNNTRVDALKRLLSERTGLEALDMILTFKDSPMQDTRCLYHYKVGKNDVIKLNSKNL